MVFLFFFSVPMKKRGSEEDARDDEASEEKTPAFHRSPSKPASEATQWAGLLIRIAAVGVAHLLLLYSPVLSRHGSVDCNPRASFEVSI
jgi:hypothetical protein